MNNNNGMRSSRNVFWGILFVLGALALLVGKIGFFEDFSFWGILFTIGLIGLLVDGIIKRNIGSILFAIAFLAILYDEVLGIEALTPWPVLGAAVLGTIGLGMLFPKYDKWNCHGGSCGTGKQMGTQSVLEGENIRFECSFGEAVKYVTSKDLAHAELECSFGSLVVYFDNAILKNNTAQIHVKDSFGGVVLYVPSDWKVVLNMSNALAGVQEKGHCNPNGINTLYIYGEVCFGGLEIRYI